MNDSRNFTPPENERLDAAIWGGSSQPADLQDEWQSLVTQLTLGSLAKGKRAEPELPPALADRIRGAWQREINPPPAAPPRLDLSPEEAASRGSGVAREWLAWMLAIAATLLALVHAPWWDEPAAPDVWQQGVASAADWQRFAGSEVTRVAWQPQADEAARNASGEIAWDAAAQRGLMKFRGLATNDPTATQYQLWIIDAQRPGESPVDGGVFDIPAGQDEVIVPFAAKLAVGRPAAFAITVEKPGGVVVSKQDRVPLLAEVPTS